VAKNMQEFNILLGVGSGAILSPISVNYAKGAVDTVLRLGGRYTRGNLAVELTVDLGSHVDFLPRGTADKGFILDVSALALYNIGKRVYVGGGLGYGLTRAMLDDQSYNASNGLFGKGKVVYDLGQLAFGLEGGPGFGTAATPGRIGGLNIPPINPLGQVFGTLTFKIPVKRWGF
jgi:hypothetical protein